MRYAKPCLQLFILALFVSVGPVPAQAQESPTSFALKLLSYNPISALLRTGPAITSLTRDDFSVYEDGVKQSIQHFEPVYAPFSFVSMLDMSGSTVSPANS